MGAALVKRCFSGDSDACDARYERRALAKSRSSSSSSNSSSSSAHSHRHHQHHHHHHSNSNSHDAAAAALLARRTLQLRQLELQMQQLTKQHSSNSSKASLSSSTPHEFIATSRSSSSRRSARATLIAPATPLSMTSSYSTTMSESSFVDAQPQDDEILDMVMANAGLAFHPTQQWTRQPQSQPHPRHYHQQHHVASSAPTPPLMRPAPLTRQRSTQSFRSLLPEAYVLQEVLGTGTTSTCYRCERRADGAAFACKVIDKRRLAVSTRQRHDIAFQLRREVDVLKRVDHPNIAKLEAAFENDAYLILLMELLDGGELFDAIVERGRFREREAIQVARAVLSAMQYMHSLGVVHRDLKPENMLLATAPLRRSNASTSASSCSDDEDDEDDEVLTVKIIDFGFAKFLAGEHATTTSFLGTGGYLAPEILLHHPYTSAVDMWAFGVLLYLLLSGRVRLKWVLWVFG